MSKTFKNPKHTYIKKIAIIFLDQLLLIYDIFVSNTEFFSHFGLSLIPEHQLPLRSSLLINPNEAQFSASLNPAFRIFQPLKSCL